MPPVLSSPLASLELGVDDFAQRFENHVLLLSSHCYCWEEVIWLFEDGYFASSPASRTPGSISEGEKNELRKEEQTVPLLH